MVDATLSRGGTSVDIPLLGDSDSLLVARDVGKPTLDTYQTGQENPRSRDHRHASDAWTIVGVLHGGTAYADAQTLAEDLIKSRGTTGTPLQLDLSNLPSRGTYDVAPASDRALTLTYEPGRSQMVGVQLTVNVVDGTIGGSQQAAGTTSPDAGDGIKLEGTSNSLIFDADQTVTRQVGRPNAKLQPQNKELPLLIDHNKPASDVFELSAELHDSSAEADAQTLEEDITRDRLGTSTLTVHFLNNLFGLDAYAVVPMGTQAVRTSMAAGQTGRVGVEKLALQVVNNPGVI